MYHYNYNMSTDLDFGIIQQDQYTLSDLTVDDNFFGLAEVNDTIDTIDTTDTTDLIESNLINNPFYVGVNNNILMNMPDMELFSKYKRCIALCKKNTCTVSNKGIYAAYVRAREWKNKPSTYLGRSGPKYSRSTYSHIATRAKRMLKRRGYSAVGHRKTMKRRRH